MNSAKIISIATLLTIAALAPLSRAQEEESRWRSADLAVTYSSERAQVATVGCPCFWLQGGSVNGSTTLFRGIGVAVNVTGEHKSDFTLNQDLNKISFLAGPRYTFNTSRWTQIYTEGHHPSYVFAEALFGVAHGFDGVFPTSTGTQSTANAFSTQIGGGLNIALWRGFGLRAFEADYIRTEFPNGTSGTQNDFRFAIGVSYHLHQR
jgi:hypothetical protein